MTKAAIYVGERRWNLRLKDGLDIRSPEQDVGNALAMLSRLDKEDKLFSRDIVAVDMRLPDRLVVQLSDDAAKAREDLFKDKKKEEGRGRRMTGLDRTQTPKTRPMPHKRGAHRRLPRYRHQQDRLHDCAAEAVARRAKPCAAVPTAVELIGYSQIQSRGMKAGAVVDLAECEQAVRQAVGLAEKMAKVRVESVLLSVSGGRLQRPAGRSRGRHPRWRRDAGRYQPRHLHRHAPRHRRGPHRAARAAGRLHARRRQGHPRSARHGRPPLRRRHERRHRARPPWPAT